MNSVRLCLLLICVCAMMKFGSTQCSAKLFEQLVSGWTTSELTTTTPLCPGCTPTGTCKSCPCVTSEIVSGPGQIGTLDGGPCAAMSAIPTCCGFTRSLWSTTTVAIPTGIDTLETEQQTVEGLGNMTPIGYYDTKMSSEGIYTFKMSTNNADDDTMGFALGYEPLTGGGVRTRIEFRWNGRCCCDYDYSAFADIQAACEPTATTHPGCCSGYTSTSTNRDRFMSVSQLTGIPFQADYNSVSLGKTAGIGWERGVVYTFQVEHTPYLIRVHRAANSGPLELIYTRINPAGFDMSGNLAFIVISQPNVKFEALQPVGEAFIGTSECSTHVPHVEVSVATNCASDDMLDIEAKWDTDTVWTTVQAPTTTTTTGTARFTKVRIENPSLTPSADPHSVIVKVKDVVAGTETTKTFSNIKVNLPVSVYIIPVNSTAVSFPVTTCPGTPPNTHLIPWCRTNIANLKVVAAGGNGLDVAANYRYQWFDAMNAPISTQASIATLNEGDYTVNVQDPLSCVKTQTAYVRKMDDPTVSISYSCMLTSNVFQSVATFTASSCNTNAAYVYVYPSGTGSSITSGPVNQRRGLKPGIAYTVQIGDSNIKCSGAAQRKQLAFSVPGLTFSSPTYTFTGTACSAGTPVTLNFAFNDVVTCDVANLRGLIDYGDGTTDSAGLQITFDPTTGTGSVTSTHHYLTARTFFGTFTLFAISHKVAATDPDPEYSVSFTAEISTLAAITLPAELIPPPVLYMYGNYSWVWSGYTFPASDRATATLFPQSDGASTFRVLDTNVRLSSNLWYWPISGVLPGQYGMEIRRNIDGCLIDNRRIISVQVATDSF